MALKRAAGGIGEIELIGAPQYDHRTITPFSICLRTLTVGSSVPGGSTISMYDSVNFAAQWPATKITHLHALTAVQSRPDLGLFVFENIDPTANLSLSFLMAMASAADPENKTAQVRIWGQSQWPTSPGECEMIGHHLGDWTLTCGACRVPTGSALLPNATDRFQWADTIVGSVDTSLSPGLRKYGETADTIAAGAIDHAGLRTLIVACGQTAATPADAVVPVLRQI